MASSEHCHHDEHNTVLKWRWFVQVIEGRMGNVLTDEPQRGDPKIDHKHLASMRSMTPLPGSGSGRMVNPVKWIRQLFGDDIYFYHRLLGGKSYTKNTEFPPEIHLMTSLAAKDIRGPCTRNKLSTCAWINALTVSKVARERALVSDNGEIMGALLMAVRDGPDAHPRVDPDVDVEQMDVTYREQLASLIWMISLASARNLMYPRNSSNEAYAKTLMHDAICLMAYPRLDDDELYTLTRVLQDAAKICSATIHANVDALLYSGKEFAGKPGAKRLGAAAIKPAPQQGDAEGSDSSDWGSVVELRHFKRQPGESIEEEWVRRCEYGVKNGYQVQFDGSVKYNGHQFSTHAAYVKYMHPRGARREVSEDIEKQVVHKFLAFLMTYQHEMPDVEFPGWGAARPSITKLVADEAMMGKLTDVWNGIQQQNPDRAQTCNISEFLNVARMMTPNDAAWDNFRTDVPARVIGQMGFDAPAGPSSAAAAVAPPGITVTSAGGGPKTRSAGRKAPSSDFGLARGFLTQKPSGAGSENSSSSGLAKGFLAKPGQPGAEGAHCAPRAKKPEPHTAQATAPSQRTQQLQPQQELPIPMEEPFLFFSPEDRREAVKQVMLAAKAMEQGGTGHSAGHAKVSNHASAAVGALVGSGSARKPARKSKAKKGKHRTQGGRGKQAAAQAPSSSESEWEEYVPEDPESSTPSGGQAPEHEAAQSQQQVAGQSNEQSGEQAAAPVAEEPAAMAAPAEPGEPLQDDDPFAWMMDESPVPRVMGETGNKHAVQASSGAHSSPRSGEQGPIAPAKIRSAASSVVPPVAAVRAPPRQPAPARAQGAGSGFTTRKDRAGTRTAPRPVSKGPANVFSVLDEDADGSEEGQEFTAKAEHRRPPAGAAALRSQQGEAPAPAVGSAQWRRQQQQRQRQQSQLQHLAEQGQQAGQGGQESLPVGGVIAATQRGIELECRICNFRGLPMVALEHFRSASHVMACSAKSFACFSCGIINPSARHMADHEQTVRHLDRVRWLQSQQQQQQQQQQRSPGNQRAVPAQDDGWTPAGGRLPALVSAPQVDLVWGMPPRPSNLPDDLPEDFECAITQNLMLDPVICTDGQTCAPSLSFPSLTSNLRRTCSAWEICTA
mmetsp:Transcript_12277/g.36923  ORF Transcript_12277/g.36923 Transcript_12277/m.36923 type:complete len:1120 (+) Transcript_12277:111-3470(+)